MNHHFLSKIPWWLPPTLRKTSFFRSPRCCLSCLPLASLTSYSFTPCLSYLFVPSVIWIHRPFASELLIFDCLFKPSASFAMRSGWRVHAWEDFSEHPDRICHIWNGHMLLHFQHFIPNVSVDQLSAYCVSCTRRQVSQQGKTHPLSLLPSPFPRSKVFLNVYYLVSTNWTNNQVWFGKYWKYNE